MIIQNQRIHSDKIAFFSTLIGTFRKLPQNRGSSLPINCQFSPILSEQSKEKHLRPPLNHTKSIVYLKSSLLISQVNSPDVIPVFG